MLLACSKLEKLRLCPITETTNLALGRLQVQLVVLGFELGDVVFEGSHMPQAGQRNRGVSIITL